MGNILRQVAGGILAALAAFVSIWALPFLFIFWLIFIFWVIERYRLRDKEAREQRPYVLYVERDSERVRREFEKTDADIDPARMPQQRQGVITRKEFGTANERLGAALTRLAPQFNWYLEGGKSFSHFDGYACQWNGRWREPRFLMFRKKRVLMFVTFSWSWDGTIDEEYLADKIANGGKDHKSRFEWYPLSNPWPPATKMPWVRS